VNRGLPPSVSLGELRQQIIDEAVVKVSPCAAIQESPVPTTLDLSDKGQNRRE
jgi:hypothetical protein